MKAHKNQQQHNNNQNKSKAAKLHSFKAIGQPVTCVRQATKPASWTAVATKESRKRTKGKRNERKKERKAHKPFTKDNNASHGMDSREVK